MIPLLNQYHQRPPHRFEPVLFAVGGLAALYRLLVEWFADGKYLVIWSPTAVLYVAIWATCLVFTLVSLAAYVWHQFNFQLTMRIQELRKLKEQLDAGMPESQAAYHVSVTTGQRLFIAGDREFGKIR